MRRGVFVHQEKQGDAERPPLGALDVDMDVGNLEGRDLRILPVKTKPSTAHEEYLSEQGTCIDVHVLARSKVSLLRSTAQ